MHYLHRVKHPNNSQMRERANRSRWVVKVIFQPDYLVMVMFPPSKRLRSPSVSVPSGRRAANQPITINVPSRELLFLRRSLRSKLGLLKRSCLSVCRNVCRISQKVVFRFQWNFVGLLDLIQGRIRYVLVPVTA